MRGCRLVSSGLRERFEDGVDIAGELLAVSGQGDQPVRACAQVNVLIARARGFRSAAALMAMIDFVHGGLCPGSPYA